MARDTGGFDEFYRARRERALEQLTGAGGAEPGAARAAVEAAFGDAWQDWALLREEADPDGWVVARAAQLLEAQSGPRPERTVFDDPASVRARADRRTRRGRLRAAGVVAAVLVLIGAGSLAARQKPTVVPVPVSTTAVPHYQVAAGLFPAEIGTGFEAQGAPSGIVPSAPFRRCGIVHAPAYEDLLAAATVTYVQGASRAGGAEIITEQIMLYRHGSLGAGYSDDVPGALDGPCHGVFSPVRDQFTGERSVLLAYVGTPAQGSGDQVQYDVLATAGDYLVWLEFTLDQGRYEEPEYAVDIASRAMNRVQCGGGSAC